LSSAGQSSLIALFTKSSVAGIAVDLVAALIHFQSLLHMHSTCQRGTTCLFETLPLSSRSKAITTRQLSFNLPMNPSMGKATMAGLPCPAARQNTDSSSHRQGLTPILLSLYDVSGRWRSLISRGDGLGDRADALRIRTITHSVNRATWLLQAQLGCVNRHLISGAQRS